MNGKSSQEILKKSKWFWPWQDENEETWLKSMSQQGWHVSKVDLAGRYTFKKGQPLDYIYRLDYRTEIKKELQSYLQLFQDAGWEHVDEMGGWQYFRKLVKPGETDEIFTDVESKIAKYNRLLWFVIPFLMMYFPLAINANEVTAVWAQIFSWAVIAFFMFIAIRVLMRINQLKKSLVRREGVVPSNRH